MDKSHTPQTNSAAKSIITMERDEKRYFRSAPPAPHENSVFRRLRRAVLSSTKTLSKKGLKTPSKKGLKTLSEKGLKTLSKKCLKH